MSEEAYVKSMQESRKFINIPLPVYMQSQWFVLRTIILKLELMLKHTVKFLIILHYDGL